MIDILLAIAIATLSIIMAVIGGVTATQKKAARASFLVMGCLSVSFVVIQAIRTTKSQDALTTSVAKLNTAQGRLASAQAELAKQQMAIQGLATGGDAYPSLWILSDLDESGKPYGKATFYLQNHDSTHSLYSISFNVSSADRGKHCCNDLYVMDWPVIPEIAPGGEDRIGDDFSFDDPIEVYELDVRARNGEFVLMAKWTGSTWIVTTKRKGSDAVLERTEQPAGRIRSVPRTAVQR
jgi:hypothetical protein